MENRRTRYIDDYQDPEMLHLALVRSPVERGRLNLVSYPDPPEELRIYGAQDIPGENRIQLAEGSMPLLADRELGYAGEALLIVAGPEKAAAEAFAEKVELDYRRTAVLPSFHAFLKEQVAAEEVLRKGEPEEALENAFQVLEGTYTVSETRPWSIDTQGAFSRFEEGQLVIYSSTQWIHHVRRTVAAALNLKEWEVLVRRTAYAAQFDEKLTYPSILAAYAALVTWNSGRPARILLSPDERLRYGPLGTPIHISHRTALSKEGALSGIDVEVDLEAGAYPLYSREALKRAGAAAAGNYTCDNVRVRTRMITTNRRPLNFSPGAGIAGCFFASETHASRIAEISQSDPLQWKLDNLDGRQSPLPDLLERVAAASDFSRKHGAYELAKKRRVNSVDESHLMRGIGIAGVYQGNGFFGRGEETERFKVTVRLESKGNLYIYTSGLAGTNRTAGLVRRRAAEILGFSRDGVVIINDDTALVPDSGPSGLSRNISVLLRLVERCCEAIKKRRFRNPLPIEASRSFRLPSRDRWEESTMQGNPYASRSWAACVVEVELDPTLFEKRVRGVWTAVDCGEVIHRHRAESSLEIGIVQALEGCGFSPDLLPEEEGLFHLPEYREIPPVSIQFNRNSRQRYASGVGDLPYVMIPPAFTAALSQASGVYFDRLPLSSRGLYRYMEEQ